MEIEGYVKVDFMRALVTWDSFNKKVKCIYKEQVYDFGIDFEWRSDFKVDGGMILDGLWYVEK